MKVSKAGIVLLVIGFILLVMAPVWKWGIGPTFVKLPDDIDVTSVYNGILTLHVDPNTLQILPEDMAVKVPLTITRKDVSQPDKSDGSVAVVEETAKAVGPNGKTFLEYTETYAMDRKTAENVPGHSSDMDRTGWRLMLPMGTEQKTYAMWDNDVGKTGDGEFVKVDKRSGFDNKDVEVYVFKASGTDPMVKPPLGLPAELSGAQVKQLTGNPNLAVSDTEMVPLKFIKNSKVTFVVEPRTGTNVDVTNFEEYFVDATAAGMGKISLASLDYKQTPQSVSEVIDNIAQYFSLLSLNSTWLPLIFLILGVVFAVIGLALVLRKRSA